MAQLGSCDFHSDLDDCHPDGEPTYATLLVFHSLTETTCSGRHSHHPPPRTVSTQRGRPEVSSKTNVCLRDTTELSGEHLAGEQLTRDLTGVCSLLQHCTSYCEPAVPLAEQRENYTWPEHCVLR